MIKRNFTLLLSSVLFVLIFFVNVNTAVQNYVPRNVDIDRSEIPKNILLGSFAGGRSHLKPMLDVTEILIQRGYNVILLTTGNYTPASEYPTVKQISLGPALDLKNFKEMEKEVLSSEFDYKKLVKFLDISLEQYKNSFEMYKKVVKDHNIDLFFCDALMNDVCLDAAHTLKKPVVGFTSFLNVISPKSYKSDPMFKCGVSLENESLFERFKCTIMRPIEIFYQFTPVINKLNVIRKENGVAGSNDLSFGGGLSKSSLTLIDNFFGFELPQTLPPNIQIIGPVLSNEYPPLAPELNDFMNKHKRVLYVAFGTRFYTTTENNDKILQSLVESIDKNLFDGVVWALVETSKDNFSPTLTLSDGKKVQTSSILNNENPNFRIMKFVPQFAMLNHTNTKLFLSHGGTGSVHESLYSGVPLLVIPMGGDQMGNGERLKSSGVALTLNKFNLNVNDILNKMNLLLNDDNVKKSSKRLKVLTKISSKGKYRGADLIEYVLHSNSLNEGEKVNEEFLKEWIPADVRMGFIRGNNFDVYAVVLSIILGIIGGILWVTLKFIVPLSANIAIKPKSE